MIIFICETDNCPNKGIVAEFLGEPESAFCTGCNSTLEPVTTTQP